MSVCGDAHDATLLDPDGPSLASFVAVTGETDTVLVLASCAAVVGTLPAEISSMPEISLTADGAVTLPTEISSSLEISSSPIRDTDRDEMSLPRLGSPRPAMPSPRAPRDEMLLPRYTPPSERYRGAPSSARYRDALPSDGGRDESPSEMVLPRCDSLPERRPSLCEIPEMVSSRSCRLNRRDRALSESREPKLSQKRADGDEQCPFERPVE